MYMADTKLTKFSIGHEAIGIVRSFLTQTDLNICIFLSQDTVRRI